MEDNLESVKTEEKKSPDVKGSSCGVGTMLLNDTKAGMQGLDLETINKIINDASKGSKYFERKLRQQQDVEKKIAEMKHKLAGFSKRALADAEIEMDKLGEQLENSRDYSRFIVHLDMDAFYASVEMRDDPSLKDKPMAVGGDSMLSTSNYVARRFGVRAGMPGFIGKKLCPQLVIVPCNFDKYKTVSKQVQKILRTYDPDFTSAGLDEAYMDITHYVETSEKTPEEIVQEMRARIFEETQLTASAGIASNGFLAKICGDMCKPNNQYTLPKTKDAEADFVKPLPIRKVNGIGGVTELLLKGLDIHTCEDIWNKRAVLHLLLKPKTSQRLIQISKGFEEPWDMSSMTEGGRKSLGSETTLDKGTTDVNFMLSVLEQLAEGIGKQLQAREMRCKTVVLKIKTVKFDVKSRSSTLDNFTSKSSVIFGAAKELLESYVKEDDKLCLRLLGIRVSKWENSGSNKGNEGNEESSSKQMKLEEAFGKQVSSNIWERIISNSKNETVGEPPVKQLKLNVATVKTSPTKVERINTKNCETTEEPPSKQLKLEEAFAKVISKSAKSFQCPACQESFATEEGVEIHLDDNCTGLYISPKSSQCDPEKNSAKAESTSETVQQIFTCPICYKQILSLVENTEIASSDHVNNCLSATEGHATAFSSSLTWKIYTATTTT